MQTMNTCGQTLHLEKKKISEKKTNKKSLLLHSVENSYYKFDLETENKIAHFSVLCFP